MKQALRRKLRSIWVGELAVVAGFAVAYWLLQAVWGEQVLGNYSLLALITLCLILLQGSGYWWLKLRQLEKESPSLNARLISFIYIVDLLLLLSYPAALVVALLNDRIESALPDALIGGGIYLFALIAFVHHFLVKLLRSDTDRLALSRRRQVTARFIRELQRSELRKKKL